MKGKRRKKDERRLIRFSRGGWVRGGGEGRGLLRGEASGQMELDCTLSVGG